MFVGRHIPFLKKVYIRIYIKFKFLKLGEESENRSKGALVMIGQTNFVYRYMLVYTSAKTQVSQIILFY